MANKWAESEGSVGRVGAPLGTGVRGRVVRRRRELCEGGSEGGREGGCTRLIHSIFVVSGSNPTDG